MLKNTIYLIILSLSVFCFLSCKKKEIITKHEVISTPVNSRINKTFWFNNDKGFFCGGEKSQQGYIYNTIDGGQTWTNSYSSLSSLYDITFINDTIGYCCGENMTVLKTIDAGLHWLSFQKKSNSDNFFYGTLYGIDASYQTVLFFGGRNFNVGFVIKAEKNVMRDGFKGFSNELRCGVLLSETSYVACGYGDTYKTIDNADSFKPYNLSGDYFTASSKVNSNLCFFSGYKGKVYRVNFETNDIHQIFNPKKRLKKQTQFNSVYFESEINGYVVGNDGFVGKTNDGRNFEILDLNSTANFHSIVSNKNNQLIISTDKGHLIRISN